MIRRLTILAALVAISFTSLTSNASAGRSHHGGGHHGGGHHGGGHFGGHHGRVSHYRSHYTGHHRNYYPRTTYVRPARVHVQPVTVVRPVTIVRPAVQLIPQAIVTPTEPNYPTVPTGSTLTIPANFLGSVPGNVFMVFNNIKLPVQVNAWTETGVTITLPAMAIKDAVLIRLDIVLPHGSVGHTQKINVTAPAPVVLHPVAPTSPLPTNAALATQ